MPESEDYLLLGPFEVGINGRQVAITAAREQITLAILLLNLGQVVSTEQLAQAIWGHYRPANPNNQIAICVSALRRKLASAGVERDILITRQPGYIAQAAADAVDMKRAEALILRARKMAADDKARAAALMRNALGMWRGPVLAGLDSPILEPERTRWEETRLATVEECVDLELELGRHNELIGELSLLVSANPLRERLRRQLMLALHRARRKPEALALFHDAHKLVKQEFGHVVGDELKRLNDAIILETVDPPATDDEPPEASSGSPRWLQTPQMLPPLVGDFTGRDKELERLCLALTPGDGGQRLPLVAVAGPGGIGKTTLSIAAAHQLKKLFPDGQLYINLNGAEHHPLAPLEVLACFLRELGVDSFAIPDDLEQRAAMFRSQLAGRRVLVVLDNAADEAQIQAILPGSDAAAVLISSRHPLTGLGGITTLKLDRFSLDESLDMLGRMIGSARMHAEHDAASEILRYCDGLPLAVRIMGAKLIAAPEQELGDFLVRLADQEKRLGEMQHGALEMRASLAISYQGLEPQAQKLLRRLAMLAVPDFAAWIGGPLLDSEYAHAEELLERIVDAQLIDVAGRDTAGQVRYRFHDIVRLYGRERAQEDETPQDRRDALSRAFGALLGLVELAHIKLLGGDYAVIHGRATRWRFDTNLCRDWIADPTAWYESERQCIIAAVRQGCELGLDELCWDLAVTSISLFGTRSHYDEWRDSHEAALTATRRSGNTVGEAAVLTGLGDLYVTQHQYNVAIEHLQAALSHFERLGHSHGYAVALRKAGYADSVLGEWRRALRRYDQALALLTESGDVGAQAHVLRWTGQLYLELGEPDRARPYLEQALELTRGSSRGYPQALYRFGEFLLACGRIDEAERAFGDVLRRVLDLRDLRGEAYALHGLGRTNLAQGQLTNAHELLTQARSRAADIGDRLIEIPTMLALADHAVAIGQLGTAATLLHDAMMLCQEIHANVWLDKCKSALDKLGFSPDPPP